MSRHEVNLTFETLEPKILLAGNVTVEQTGAGLKIAGDGESNSIRIVRVNADTVQVRGADGTTVNRTEGGEFELDGRSVKLDFKQGGNDIVAFVSLTSPDLELNKVKGRFGNGNDEVSFTFTNTAQVGLKMGDGNNRVTSQNSSLRGKVSIQTGVDNDVIMLQGGGVQSLGKTGIATGEGLDFVEVSGFSTAGLVEQLTVKLNGGQDEFFGSANKFVGKAAVDGGDGDDTGSGAGNTFAPGNPIVTNVETRAGQW